MIKNRLPPNPDIRITPKSVYVLYLILKQHMNGRYDAIKYNWCLRVTDAAFNKRRDRYYFTKLSEKYTLRELYFIFLSNLVANTDAWVGEIVDIDALAWYREYIGKISGASTKFDDEIKDVFYFAKRRGVTLKQLMVYNPETQTSGIFKLLQNRVISFETFMMLDSILNIIEKHDEVAKDLIWQTYSVKLKAYRKLLVIDSNKVKQQFITTVKNCNELYNQ